MESIASGQTWSCKRIHQDHLLNSYNQEI